MLILNIRYVLGLSHYNGLGKEDSLKVLGKAGLNWNGALLSYDVPTIQVLNSFVQQTGTIFILFRMRKYTSDSKIGLNRPLSFNPA